MPEIVKRKKDAEVTSPTDSIFTLGSMLSTISVPKEIASLTNLLPKPNYRVKAPQMYFTHLN